MRILLSTCLILLCFSCAQKDAGRSFLKLIGRNLDPSETSLRTDSTVYVGYVDYFPDTHEFYTTLYYREGREHPDEDLLASRLDSVILVDDDWGRERLPIEEARTLLVLDGLDTLSIFDRDHKNICHCPLTRVEYLWNGLESYFIAVFSAEPGFAGQTEELYGVSRGLPEAYKTVFSNREVKDPTFDRFLINKLDLAADESWSMRHYEISPPGATYSVLSTMGHSYLTYFENNKAAILNEEVDNFQYLNILPIPIQVNGKPLLLISAGYPSSDMLWDYLAAFDGSHYEAVNYNRVNFNQINPEWAPALYEADVKAGLAFIH